MLLLLSAFVLFGRRDAGLAGGMLLLIVGLGLLLAAFKSLKPPGGSR